MELSVLRYIPVLIIIGLFFGFIWKQWNFFKGVLSDGTPVTDKDGAIVRDKDNNPIFLGSTTRVLAFMFGLGMLICEIYVTIKNQDFDYKHLIAFLMAIGCLVGAVKFVDALSIIKGNAPKNND